MKISRTYPQPDSPQPHIGSRERALAVFKYVLGIEPEAAAKHEHFALVVHAFEQAEKVGWNKAVQQSAYGELFHSSMPASVVPLLRGETEFEPVVQPFAKDGL